MKENLVILIDGSYYLYSIYYALPNLINSYGEPTRVIYGIVNVLKNIYIKYRPIYMVVVFDAPGDTFRDDLFKDYKLYRKSMPVDLCIQLPAIYRIINAMGLPIVITPGVEADDVIGTLSVFFSSALKCNVYVFSGDKDMMQLVTSNVFVVDTRRNILFTSKEVKKKFGIYPSLIIDYLALLGDTVDNVPGVPGIGRVTAKFLLQRIGNLNFIYQNLDKVNNLIGLRGGKSVALKLQKNRFLAFLSYELVTIRKNVLLNISYDSLSIKSLDIDVLVFLFQRYEFKRWVKLLLSGNWLKSI